MPSGLNVPAGTVALEVAAELETQTFLLSDIAATNREQLRLMELDV